MDGNILGYGGDEVAVQEEEAAPLVIAKVEKPWEWVMEGGDPSKYFSPEIDDVVEFGDDSKPWDVEFPSKKYKMRLKDDKILLTGIKYKFDKFSPERYMTAVQFEYSDGNVGPKIETEPSKLVDWKQITIPKSAAVRKINMAVDADSGGVVGIQL